MKGLFSRKLYIEGLKRIKIAGIVAAISVIFLNAIVPVVEIISDRRQFANGYIGGSISSVEPYEFLPFGLLMLAFGAVFAYSMFSFLNERNRSDFFHAIPHKRVCVYLSFVAAIFTWIFGILTVSAGVNALLFCFAKFSTVNLSVVLVTPLVLVIASTMIAAFMTLAMTLTGTAISNSLIFVLLLLFGRTIGQIFVTALRELAPILRHGNSFLNYLEFEFSLPFVLLSGDGYDDNTPLVIYTAILAVLVFALGAFCYVRRKSETATKSAPSKLMQHIYRSAITLPFFLFVVLTAITDGLDASVQLVMLVLALLVYCIFELMTTKKIQSLVKALPMILIPIALAGAFTGAVFIARNAVLNQVPELDELEAIGEQNSISYSPTYQELRTNETFVETREAKEIVLTALKRDIDQIRRYGTANWTIRDENGKTVDEISAKLIIQFRLENGRKFGRYIGFTLTEYERLMALMLESPDYLEAYLDLPTNQEIDSISVDGYDIDRDDVKRLWASFKLEFSSLSREEKLAYLKEKYRNEEVAKIYVGGTYRLKTFHSNYPMLYEYMPETSKMYLEMAADAGYVDDDIELLRSMSEKLSGGGTVVEEYVDFEIVATELTGETAGEECYMNAVKTQDPLTSDMVKQMLDFLIEKGEVSYDPTNVLVRFRIGLYNYHYYFYEDEESFKASSISVETVDTGMWISNLILSFEKEEWEEFKALVKSYGN